MLLKTVNLKKRFFKNNVLNDFYIEIEKGYIYGLIGPNGSGKSTFMKIIADLVKKTSGEIYFEEELYTSKTKKNIAYQPTEDYFYSWMKVKDVLLFYKDFYSDFQYEKGMKLVEEMNLDLNQRISSLSTGQKGRLKVLLVLSRNVPLYMLDEPLNGIDPKSRDVIMSLIASEVQEKKTIIISSHLINEFETILDKVIFLKDGQALFNKDCEELRMETGLSINDYYKKVYD